LHILAGLLHIHKHSLQGAAIQRWLPRQQFLLPYDSNPNGDPNALFSTQQIIGTDAKKVNPIIHLLDLDPDLLVTCSKREKLLLLRSLLNNLF
jgi:hypothetical protein